MWRRTFSCHYLLAQLHMLPHVCHQERRGVRARAGSYPRSALSSGNDACLVMASLIDDIVVPARARSCNFIDDARRPMRLCGGRRRAGVAAAPTKISKTTPCKGAGSLPQPTRLVALALMCGKPKMQI